MKMSNILPPGESILKELAINPTIIQLKLSGFNLVISNLKMFATDTIVVQTIVGWVSHGLLCWVSLPQPNLRKINYL